MSDASSLKDVFLKAKHGEFTVEDAAALRARSRELGGHARVHVVDPSAADPEAHFREERDSTGQRRYHERYVHGEWTEQQANAALSAALCSRAGVQALSLLSHSVNRQVGLLSRTAAAAAGSMTERLWTASRSTPDAAVTWAEKPIVDAVGFLKLLSGRVWLHTWYPCSGHPRPWLQSGQQFPCPPPGHDLVIVYGPFRQEYRVAMG